MPSHHHQNAIKNAAVHHQDKSTTGGSAAAAAGAAADNNPDRIEWSRSTILSFIEDYRQKRVLWDPNTKGYHIKQIKYEALKQLGHKYGTEIRSIRSKIKSLRSSFHREHGKVINGNRRGIHYQPMWFAYEAIRFILEAEQPQHHRPNDTEQRRSSEETRRETLVALAAAARCDAGVEEEEEVGIKVDVAAAAGGAPVGGRGVSERRRIFVGSVADVELEDLSCKRSGRGARRQLTAELVEELHNAGGGGDGSSSSSSSSSVNGNNVAVDQAAVKCAEIDGEMNHYCNISAEDVKTELIESESSDSPQTVADKTHQHQSPLAYLSLTAVHHHRTDASIPKKRKRIAQPENAMSSKKHNGESGGPSQCKMMNTNTNNSKCNRSIEESPSTTVTPTKFGGGGGNNLQTDEYGVFGEYVAITIRKLKTSKSKIVVKHLINNLLYEAELGKYDYGIPASKEPPQLYKTS